MSLVATFFSMIDRPRQAFTQVAQRPRSWWLPALLVVVSLVALSLVVAPQSVELSNQRSQQMMESIMQNLSEEQAQQVQAQMAQGSGSMTTTTFLLSAVGGGLVLAALGWVARGAIVHFGSMLVGGTSAWPASFALGVWSMIPFFFRDLFQMAYVAITGQLIENAGLSFLVASPDWLANSRNAAYLALSQVDPFVLWHIVLLAIGLATINKLSKGGAAVMAVVIWLLFAAVKILPTILGTALMGGLSG